MTIIQRDKTTHIMIWKKPTISPYNKFIKKTLDGLVPKMLPTAISVQSGMQRLGDLKYGFYEKKKKYCTRFFDCVKSKVYE